MMIMDYMIAQADLETSFALSGSTLGSITRAGTCYLSQRSDELSWQNCFAFNRT